MKKRQDLLVCWWRYRQSGVCGVMAEAILGRTENHKKGLHHLPAGQPVGCRREDASPLVMLCHYPGFGGGPQPSQWQQRLLEKWPKAAEQDTAPSIVLQRAAVLGSERLSRISLGLSRC